MNPLSPKKLLLTKWTAVTPHNREKHFVVVRVIEPEPPSIRVEQVELEAVHSRQVYLLHWRELFRFVRHPPLHWHIAAPAKYLTAGVGQSSGEETAGRAAVVRGRCGSMALVA